MRTDDEKRQVIRANLDNVITRAVIPELGESKQGKVGEVFFKDGNVIRVTTDRVSAFDRVVGAIPFKGEVLTGLSYFAMSDAQEVWPTALKAMPDPNVLVQEECKNAGIEAIARAFVWGSMARAYESGERVFCGIQLPDGLLRYQMLDEPLFTPTTKASVGHDENMTYDEVVAQLGEDTADTIRDATMRLFARARSRAAEHGFEELDTKYEFGINGKGELVLIDEADTPDSSRFVKKADYVALWPQVERAMKDGSYPDVSALLKAHPELKIPEHSKQVVRDAILEMSEELQGVPSAYREDVFNATFSGLGEEVVVEASLRYINLFEKFTGRVFDFSAGDPNARLYRNLRNAGYIKGGCAVIIAGSDSDEPHVKGLADALRSYGVPFQARVCSAHKQPEKAVELLQHYNQSLEPLVLVSVAGGTDALSGLLAYHSVHPVVSCPPDADVNSSCLLNPPGSSNAYVKWPKNAARFVAQQLSYAIPGVREHLLLEVVRKVEKLGKADDGFTERLYGGVI